MDWSRDVQTGTQAPQTPDTGFDNTQRASGFKKAADIRDHIHDPKVMNQPYTFSDRVGPGVTQSARRYSTGHGLCN